MARSFLGALAQLERAAAADQRRAQNAAIRQHNALARQSERYFKQAERERLAQEKESAIQYAADKTSEAEQKRNELNSLTKSACKIPLLVDLNSLKQTEPFPKPAPKRPCPQPLPECPDETRYAPKFGLLDWLFKSRKEKAIQLARDRLNEALDNHEELTKNIELANIRATRDYEEKYRNWNAEKEEFKNKQDEHNASVDKMSVDFAEGEKNAVEFFFDAVLQHLELPEEIELQFQWQLQYDASSKILIVDFDLPDLEVVPKLKVMKYVITRKEFSETFLKEKEVNQIYDELLLQLCLRVTNDLYVSDINDNLASVVFNGIYNGLSKSTGKEETKCIMSLQTQKVAFLDMAIENVDAKTCFLKFKGVAGNKLSEFVPIAPVLAMNRTDARFVESTDVSGMVNGMNLASMDWESFEHLIRELFEKEFTTNGAEVRITRASRDGGVDAVMFDPDPIRGGKYVIQAKRYTNVVGVAAVRDLYGTLMNEGAVKGILVTTANYGADSYEFAKDKPITLINGSNLLHMLQRHGYQARIDLEEAKRLMSEEK